MSDDLFEIEAIKHFQLEQSKYFYILLAFTASAILYTLKLLDNRIVEWRLLPAGLSVLFWLISLYMGMKWLQYKNSALYDNAELLQTRSRRPSKTPDNEIEWRAKIAALYSVIENKSNKCGKYAKWQVRLVIWGVITFVLWFALEMILRTYQI